METTTTYGRTYETNVSRLSGQTEHFGLIEPSDSSTPDLVIRKPKKNE